MKNPGKLFFSVVVYVLAAVGCNNDDEPKRSYLVSADSYLLFKADVIRALAAELDLDVDASEIKYDVEIFKVVYQTEYKGEVIEASGLIALPLNPNESVGMVSFQHGTISANGEAPSQASLGDQTTLLYGALASPGLIAVVPDFIGFGASSEIFHPYYVEKPTADAVLDMLKAARELASQKNIEFNQRLFLAGYSQGGYATMAAHKAIEEDGLSGFQLIASFPAAGGYDVKEMQEYFFDQVTYDQPYYLAYVARSYQTYYDWESQSLSDFFQEPYASRIPQLFNNNNGAGAINAQLTETIADYVQPDLLANIDTDPKYSYLVEAFNENSLTDWVPTKTMVMYHGTADTTVPYQNSVSTYNTFVAAGASQGSLSLVDLPGADHSSGVIPYINFFIRGLLDLK